MIVVQTLIAALSLGSLYAVLALGLALVASIMRLVNFAHGELIMGAAYAMAFSFAFGPAAMIAAALVVGVVLALASDQIGFRALRSADSTTLFISSFAISFLLQNTASALFGSTSRTVPALPALSQPITIGEISFPMLDIVIIATAAVLLGGLTLLLKKTRTGLRMRAAAEDFRVARTLGVRANRVIALGFGLSGLFAAFAAVIVVAQSGVVSPTMGSDLVLIAFIACVLGGLGSLPGAVVGGFVLGVLTVVLQAYLPVELKYYRDAFAFGAVIILLVWRPQGLLPSATAGTRV